MTAGGAAIGTPPLGIVRHLPQCAGQRRRVAGRDEDPGLLTDHLPHPADVGGNRGQSRGAGLDQRHRRALVVRGEDRQVGGGEERAQLTAVAEEEHVALDPQLARQRFQTRPLLAVADQRQPQPRPWPARLSQRPQQHVEALDRHHAADEDQQDLLRRDVQLAAGPLSQPAVVGLGQRPEVEPEGQHREALARGDAESHEVVDRRLADSDQAVADPCQGPLQLQVEP